MHKFENGIRIELTKDEALEQEKNWEEAIAYIERKRSAASDEKKKEAEILMKAGLIKEVINCLRPDLKELINSET